MTQAEALARLRMLIDESSAGKWSDNELYDCLDAGQNAVIQMALTKEKIMPGYKSSALIPLIVLDSSNTTTIGSGYQEYSLPSDFLATHTALYSYTNAGTQYPCAIVDFGEAVKRSVNAYANNFKTPLTYTRAEKLGFMPQPIGAGASNYAHYYYKQPSTVASGQDFTLREETHEAIVEYGAYYALQKRADQTAFIHLQNFLKIVEGIC